MTEALLATPLGRRRWLGSHMVVAFAGDAFLQCPLTLDHQAFLRSLRVLDGAAVVFSAREGVEAQPLRCRSSTLKAP